MRLRLGQWLSHCQVLLLLLLLIIVNFYVQLIGYAHWAFISISRISYSKRVAAGRIRRAQKEIKSS